MPQIDRRRVLMSAVAAMALPPSIAKALTIDAHVRTGTLADVEHVVIFMQENRSFDHYFGAMNGVRGFGDRFPIPVPDAPGLTGKSNWTQVNGRQTGAPPLISPFPLDTAKAFGLMRVEGTPHSWDNAQDAWNEGRMNHWPEYKHAHAMGYYRKADIPFQYALADAFTLCDSYHCAMQTGTNSNRLFLWTGTNDPSGQHGGPSISNSHDDFADKGGAADPFRWTAYVERLEAAGVSWRIYQDMADNFTDNPLAGFKAFRDSYAKVPGSDPVWAQKALSTRLLDGLREDVLAGTLPQVSYVIAPAKDSEHPGPSSPAQGADFTAQVISALTADPKVWSKTVLLLMFDENDGFFDHVPPPAPPSADPAHNGAFHGASTVDTTGEYHLVRNPTEAKSERDDLMGRPYGLGPRVPLYVISPWSRGGWVNSQVFDHTSVIMFLEKRFGVMEPNISPWRRSVCGDLTTTFNFKSPNDAPFVAALPETRTTAVRADKLLLRSTPKTPATPLVPVQAGGIRPSRALPYALRLEDAVQDGALHLTFCNDGSAGAVFHVYDRRNLTQPPRRYTVEAGKRLSDGWAPGAYDLWVLGPNGFHRHLIGDTGRSEPTVSVNTTADGATLQITVRNGGSTPLTVAANPNAYGTAFAPWTVTLASGAEATTRWPLRRSAGWHDLSVTSQALKGYHRRFAGRVETGSDSFSDPAMEGPAVMDQA
jgi:phospholipase C